MDQEDVRWFKSSYSGGSGTECVEVAAFVEDVAVRDSKAPHGPRISFDACTWAAFVTALRGDRLA
jgi:hypothetical protein